MPHLKLHISPCPNDTFMFDAIVNQRIDPEDMTFEARYFDIEELNRGVARGEADISKISYAMLPQIVADYALLDSGSALGRGNGPLLVRRQGATDPIRTVAIPGLQTTANALLTRLFPQIETKTPLLFSEIASAVKRGAFDAGVLIHEGRFLYKEHNLELVADLGERWEQTTALPLPLGAIVMKRDLSSELRAKFERLLHRSIEYAFTHPAVSRTYIKEHAQEMDDAVIDAHIALFVNDYSLSLGAEGRRAVAQLTGLNPGSLNY
ncbi:MAG: 1,4-dihydroxy-6-naphthoate synthase [Alistipes sp.]